MKVEFDHHVKVEDLQREVKKTLLLTKHDEPVHCPHCQQVTETLQYVCKVCSKLKGHPYLEKQEG